MKDETITNTLPIMVRKMNREIHEIFKKIRKGLKQLCYLLKLYLKKELLEFAKTT